MTNAASAHVNGGSTKVAGFLSIVGAMAYALVGGPLVVAGGIAIGLALIAYRHAQN